MKYSITKSTYNSLFRNCLFSYFSLKINYNYFLHQTSSFSKCCIILFLHKFIFTSIDIIFIIQPFQASQLLYKRQHSTSFLCSQILLFILVFSKIFSLFWYKNLSLISFQVLFNLQTKKTKVDLSTSSTVLSKIQNVCFEGMVLKPL